VDTFFKEIGNKKKEKTGTTEKEAKHGGATLCTGTLTFRRSQIKPVQYFGSGSAFISVIRYQI